MLPSLNSPVPRWSNAATCLRLPSFSPSHVSNLWPSKDREIFATDSYMMDSSLWILYHSLSHAICSSICKPHMASYKHFAFTPLGWKPSKNDMLPPWTAWQHKSAAWYFQPNLLDVWTWCETQFAAPLSGSAPRPWSSQRKLVPNNTHHTLT